MNSNNPLVSIITVSFNSVKTIEKTILSILNQTYKNIEYIIIDGGSSDGTVDIIKKYSDKISYFVSEKDNGIYDAMNKGVVMAHGDYLNFMNSDDYFFSNKTIDKCIPFLDGQYDIVYGNVEVRYDDFKFIKKEPSPKYLWMGPLNHQSSFIKMDTMIKYKYDISNKIVADYELFLKVYYNNGKILKINEVIASYYNVGYSQKNYKQLISDCQKTIKKYNNNFLIDIYYFFIQLKPFIKKIVSKKIFRFIKKKIIIK